MAKLKHFPNPLAEAIRYFADPDTSLTFLASLRWPKGATCPACEAGNPGFLKTRRIWKCRECGRQFSVKLGTIFEDRDRKSTRLNSSHVRISYAVFCLKIKTFNLCH